IGSYCINVSVDDGNGGIDFHNFTLTVNETNLPPVITTPNIEWALEDSLYWVDYEYTDGNGDSVTWQLMTNASWLNIDVVTGILSGTPDNSHVGSFWVNVSCDDGYGGIDFTNFVLTVNNTPPILINTPVTQTMEDEPFWDDFNCSDDNQGDIEYSLLTNATWLTINPSTGELSGTPDNNHVGWFWVNVTVGWFWVNVTVDDGNGGNDSMNYTLTVDNSPPIIITFPITTTYVGKEYFVDFNSTDDGQGSITYYLQSNASWLNIDELTGVVNGTPLIDDIGYYWVNVTVEDGNGGSDSINYTLKVIDFPVHNLDTGEGFWSIQEAIDDIDTLNGHTIFVEEGTYFENVWVTKSINLVGEDEENTIIDGSGSGDVIRIVVDWVNVSGFTLQNGRGSIESAGVAIESGYNNIYNNTMTSNRNGVFLYPTANENIVQGNHVSDNDNGIRLNSSDYNYIYNNSLKSNDWENIVLFKECFYNNVSSNIIMLGDRGIYLYSSSYNTIYKNIVWPFDWTGISLHSSDYNNIIANHVKGSSTGANIYIRYSNGNNITDNHISYNEKGIHVYYSENNLITRNQILYNNYGVYLEVSSNNKIYHNNFKENSGLQAYDDQDNNFLEVTFGQIIF
ncbi:MAG: NosD domain-containing protein, partial [Candidatus Kariarchaeaceae archaeon]